MIIDNVNIGPLLKAFAKFENFRQHLGTEQEKVGAIQAFEYCFELVWKTMKRLLEGRGITINSPREAFRMAALEGLIHDPELWFEFLKKRNLTVDVYEENAMTEVVEIFEDFSRELRCFLQKIEITSHAEPI